MLTQQEALYSASSACIYLARWAMARGKFLDAFAPQSAFARRLLRSLPTSLLKWTSGFFARVLLRFSTGHEITDGNVNFSFAVRGRDGKASLFVKQARGYLKWQPQMSLERERMAREVQYFRDASAALDNPQLAARYLPRIHDFDENNSVLVMDYLSRHTVLFEQLFLTGRIHREAAEGLGEYLALVASRTLGQTGGDHASSQRAVHYWNPTMRAIQEEHVYTICFEKSEIGQEVLITACSTQHSLATRSQLSSPLAHSLTTPSFPCHSLRKRTT